ncbi:MAG: lipoyl(octanoyl) transferase LipB [Methylococcales bacterium]|nr:lipoyl(octanoyl) transferase LipB [Methylococcales bacterium]
MIIRQLGRAPYAETWHAMRHFTEQRQAGQNDELWLVEHPPVYTLGLNGDHKHILNAGAIPIVQSDRGGQVTYHGPGQLILYTLLDLNHRQLGPSGLVKLLEHAMVSTLKHYGLRARTQPGAPGVYIDDQKIGSIGLRIKRGASYHGLSLNNNMDLRPFTGINPCGYERLTMTQLADFSVHITTSELAVPLIHAIQQGLRA